MSTPTAPAALAFPTGGACTDRPELMTPDPNNPEALDAAVETCLSCTAYLACLAWVTAIPADQDPGGIIAALTETERAEQRGTPTLPTRHCPRCDQDKAPSDFHASARAWCADCVRTYAKARYHRLNPGARTYVPTQGRTHKKCPSCTQTKPVKDFAGNSARRDGRDSTCKTCRNARDRQRRAARQGRA
ncbi:hypothetical protein [Streptosporangium sp. NPDC048865]|uniref:hypothetical protein n=1 Tax=Streptosporangium sp. NPDC048865 TaxID=3155766 RepID=UPI0034438F8B